jgi:hypothetical protein
MSPSGGRGRLGGVTDEIRDKIRRRYEETEATPPLEKLRHFLQGHVSDAESMEEVRLDLRRQLQLPVLVPGRPARHALEGLEYVLTMPVPEGPLASLVAWDANRSLDDPSDEGARRWLEDLAVMLKDELAAAGVRTRWPGEE